MYTVGIVAVRLGVFAGPKTSFPHGEYMKCMMRFSEVCVVEIIVGSCKKIQIGVPVHNSERKTMCNTLRR